MKIKEIKHQNRRDFYADYECESCGHVQYGSGYDDRNFHDNVIPSMKCKNCGESRNNLGLELEESATPTRYPEGMQV